MKLNEVLTGCGAEVVSGRVPSLDITGVFDVPLEQLRVAWTATLPAALG